MSTTANNKTTANNNESTNPELSKFMEEIRQGQMELMQKQDNAARKIGDFEGRLKQIEQGATKQQAAETLEAAVEEAQAVKAGALGKFKQASTGKKVVIATVATAAVAGVGYGAYKGYEMYQGRKAVLDGNILGAEAVNTAITPAKQDAIRQGLSISK